MHLTAAKNWFCFFLSPNFILSTITDDGRQSLKLLKPSEYRAFYTRFYKRERSILLTLKTSTKAHHFSKGNFIFLETGILLSPRPPSTMGKGSSIPHPLNSGYWLLSTLLLDVATPLCRRLEFVIRCDHPQDFSDRCG